MAAERQTGEMGSSLQFRSGSCIPNRSYLSSNTLLIQDTSPFHKQCIPKETRDRVKSAPSRFRNVRDYEVCNLVAEERVWDERCRKEASLQKQWDTKYGFLTEYDQYGEPKEKKEISKEVPSIYSLTKQRPLTASREYGHRVNTQPAKQMNNLQMRMSRGMKRNKDLLYCD